MTKIISSGKICTKKLAMPPEAAGSPVAAKAGLENIIPSGFGAERLALVRKARGDYHGDASLPRQRRAIRISRGHQGRRQGERCRWRAREFLENLVGEEKFRFRSRPV